MNLIKPTNGSIEVIDSEGNTLNFEEIISNFAYLPQEPVIFNETIFNNINMTLENKSAADCHEIFQGIKNLQAT